MDARSKVLRRLVFGTMLAALGACGNGGPSYDPDSPDGKAYLYRDAVMELADAKASLLVGMTRQEVAFDEAAFAKAASDLAALSAMMIDGFRNETLVEESRTSPEVWKNFDDFERQVRDFVEATRELANTAETGGFAAAEALVQPTMQQCGACHRPYRLPRERSSS